MNSTQIGGGNRMMSAISGGLGYTTPTQAGTSAGGYETSRMQDRRSGKPEFRRARDKARKVMRRRNQA